MKTKAKTLTLEMLHGMNAWWRAVSHLSVGQVHLYDSPLLQKPPTLLHINRLLGHWGTTPELNFTYVKLKPRAGPVDASSNDSAGSAHVLDCPVVGWSQRTRRLSMVNQNGGGFGLAHMSERRA
jgi:XFP N-terminal domain